MTNFDETFCGVVGCLSNYKWLDCSSDADTGMFKGICTNAVCGQCWIVPKAMPPLQCLLFPTAFSFLWGGCFSLGPICFFFFGFYAACFLSVAMRSVVSTSASDWLERLVFVVGDINTLGSLLIFYICCSLWIFWVQLAYSTPRIPFHRRPVPF